MSRGYGQYCPFSLAVELLCQRWTLLIVSRLLMGCTRFNELRRSMPRISPTLLSKRLAELERAGLVESKPLGDRPGREVRLTAAGEALQPIVIDLTVWGQQWARDLADHDLDPAFLVWSMHTRVDRDALPDGQTVIEFSFSGAPSDTSRFWLVCRPDSVEMCLKDPELDVDLLVRSDLRRFVEVWRGFRDLRREIASGQIEVVGPPKLTQQLPDWLELHQVASVPRMQAGAERDLWESKS